jgi:serine/threonine-protein kinase
MLQPQRCPRGHQWWAEDTSGADPRGCPLCRVELAAAEPSAIIPTLIPVSPSTSAQPPPLTPSVPAPSSEDNTLLGGSEIRTPQPAKALQVEKTLHQRGPLPGQLPPRPTDHRPDEDGPTRPEGEANPRPAVVRRRIAGYEILGELGRGGMGVVYQARQVGLNRLCAIKMILGGGHAGPEILARFKTEAEAIAQLQHPNIVQVYEIGTEGGHPFFSLEYVDGKSLDRFIDGAPQPPREAVRLMQAICTGVEFAHRRGIVHRDLKPANILLTQDGTPKITDFGLAKRLQEEDRGQTRTGAVLGTPSYMAPEQAQGRGKDVGPLADVYSLGAILYDMLTGRPPFRGETVLDTLQQVQTLEPLPPVRLVPKVPRDLETICLKALAKSPAKRYASAAAMAEDLRRVQAGEPILARPASWAERTVKWVRRRPTLASLIGVSCLGLVAILTFGGLWLNSERLAAEEHQRQQAQLADSERQRRLEAETQKNAIQAQQAETQRQRDRAAANFRQALQAVDEMLTRVATADLALEPRTEQVRLKLLEKARQFYQDFLREAGDDPSVRYEAGRAYQRVGDVHRFLSQYDEAEKHYRLALARFAEMLAKDPRRTDVLQSRADATDSLGTVLKELSRLPEAEEQFTAAVAQRKQLWQAEPDNTTYAGDLTRSLDNLGAVQLAQRQPGRAAELFREGLTLAAPWAKGRARPDLVLNVADLEMNLGSALKDLDQVKEAAAALDSARQHLEGLASRHPEVVKYRHRLALCLKQTGDLHRDTNPKLAGDAYRASLKLREALARDYPTAPLYRQELADTWLNLAVYLQAAGDTAEAEKAYQQGCNLQEKVVEQSPGVPDFRKLLAGGYANRAALLLTLQRLDEAEALLGKALRICEELVKERPQVTAYREELANVQGSLALLYQAAGRDAEAGQAFAGALQLREKLTGQLREVRGHRFKLAQLRADYGVYHSGRRQLEAAEGFLLAARTDLAALVRDYPEVLDYAAGLAVCELNLAVVYRDSGRADLADATLVEALTRFRELAAKQPGVPQYRQMVGRALYERGILLGSRTPPDFTAAVASLQQAIEVQQPLAEEQPQIAAFRVELAQSCLDLGIASLHAKKGQDARLAYEEGIRLLEELKPSPAAMPAVCNRLALGHVNYGNLLAALKEVPAAETSWKRALELQEALVKVHPAVAEYQSRLAQSHTKFAGRLLKVGKFAPARDHATEALAHLRKAVELLPDDGGLRQGYYDAHLTLANADLALQDHAAAAKVLGSMPGTPADLRNVLIAGAYGRCMLAAQQDKALSDPQRKELVKQYGEQALTALRGAVAKGYREVQQLKEAPEFELLRSWPAFQQMVRELEKK